MTTDEDTRAEGQNDPTLSLPDNRYLLQYLLRHLDGYVEAIDRWVAVRGMWRSKASVAIESGHDAPAFEVDAPEMWLPPEVLCFLPDGESGDRDLAAQLKSELENRDEAIVHGETSVEGFSRLCDSEQRLSAALLEFVRPHRRLRFEIFDRLQQLDEGMGQKSAKVESASEDSGPSLLDLLSAQQATGQSQVADILARIDKVASLRGHLGTTVDAIDRIVTREGKAGRVVLKAPAEWYAFWIVFQAGEDGLSKDAVERHYESHPADLTSRGAKTAVNKVNERLAVLGLRISNWKLITRD